MPDNYLLAAKNKVVPTTNTSAPPPSQKQVENFSDWTGTGVDDGPVNSNTAALDLKKRGLIGSDQLVTGRQDMNTPMSTYGGQNSQRGIFDWKIGATREILQNIRKLNLRTPEEIKANQGVLLKNPVFKNAVNDPVFQQTHPNFWGVVNGIVKDQYAKEDAQKQSLLAKK